MCLHYKSSTIFSQIPVHINLVRQDLELLLCWGYASRVIITLVYNQISGLD